MKSITITFDYDQEIIDAFANWLGNPGGNSLDYIIQRLVKGPFLDHVAQFQKDMVDKATQSKIESSVQDAAGKLTIQF